MKITLRQLKRLGACTEQINLFKEIFGTSVELTEEIVIEHGHKFDVDWLANRVLTPTQLADYEAKRAPLWADYEAKRAPLWADYEAKRAPLWADYQAKRVLLLADYEAKLAPLWADYQAKRAPLLADYEAKCAPFWDDYWAKRALIFWEVVK